MIVQLGYTVAVNVTVDMDTRRVTKVLVLDETADANEDEIYGEDGSVTDELVALWPEANHIAENTPHGWPSWEVGMP